MMLVAVSREAMDDLLNTKYFVVSRDTYCKQGRKIFIHLNKFFSTFLWMFISYFLFCYKNIIYTKFDIYIFCIENVMKAKNFEFYIFSIW